ncbi:putative zinc-binding protein [Rhodoferax saidenbachensis]|uniref:Metal-binding protein n=1 Tax=Rhodoferax saidenbachensis TaxID=1484693 RepID=A0ABU1ZTA8_9BURK|nr:putative zinc-binding protein [Rhodoferax saidenbachensis]MDR7308794.1 putative metal-binding protein [Rhodoferax saidenbachensis]
MSDATKLRAQQQRYAELPLVYACSGCSSAAQLANQMALRLDHAELAEMSCIAGVGAGVKPLARTARSGRPILALDGCPLHCVRHALAQQGVRPTVHLDLSDHGVRKDLHRLPSSAERDAVWADVVLPALQQTISPTPADATSKEP